MRIFLKSKIHRATVTESDLNYEGSISIDASLMRRAGIEEFEKVDVWNITNGERIETYAMPAPKNSGTICLNGAAARKFMVGDRIIISSFEIVGSAKKPRIIIVDEKNKPV